MSQLAQVSSNLLNDVVEWKPSRKEELTALDAIAAARAYAARVAADTVRDASAYYAAAALDAIATLDATDATTALAANTTIAARYAAPSSGTLWRLGARVPQVESVAQAYRARARYDIAAPGGE